MPASTRFYLVFCLLVSPLFAHGKAPNVLLIIGDDCTYNDLPLHGGTSARTPHIDALAAEGLTFNRAYLAMSMCQPCRAELFTGQYPIRNGCAWNHAACRPETTSLPHHLGGLGYRVGLAGKQHLKPVESFPFELLDGFDPICVRNPTNPHDLAAARQFIQRDAAQPFCLVLALVEPHVPWVMGDPSAYPAKDLELPPNLADTPLTRKRFASYLAEITYMDRQIGEILAMLDDSGRRDDTLVLFTSEQGAQLPGCKWTAWDTGLHTSLVARWPGVAPAGQRTDALVQYADVAPTLVELAGGDPTLFDYDGSSFASVLRGESNRHRRFVYGMHNNIPEGAPYPSRTVSNGEWRYIRNLTPDRLYLQKFIMGRTGDAGVANSYWQTWLWDSWNTPRTYDLVHRYQKRPPEELYHTTRDPYELENLVTNSAHAEVLDELRAELDRWMDRQKDPGEPVDTHEAWSAAKRGQHLHGDRG